MPQIQIKDYRNTPWSAVLVNKKVLAEATELCEKKGVTIEDMIGALFIKIIKTLEEEE